MSKTRKELIEDVSDGIHELSRAIEEHSVSATTHQVEVVSPDAVNAATRLGDSLQVHGNSMESATDNLVGGIALAVGGLLFSGIVNAAIKNRQALEEVIHEVLRLIEVLQSLEKMNERKGRVSFDEAARKTYARGTTIEERTTFLNNLIYQDIIEIEEINGEDYLFVNQESEEYNDFWDRIEKFRSALFPDSDEA
jgi:hypothetical protein